MKILAIEASSEQASVALPIDGAISSRRIDGATKHSQTVLRDVRDLLAEAGLPIGALDAVAFGAGPGAFTGLRLACGVAQGLALGADLGIAVVGGLMVSQVLTLFITPTIFIGFERLRTLLSRRPVETPAVEAPSAS